MVSYPDAQQTNLIGILGYNSDVISLAVEWNQQINTNSLDGYERSGLSAYATYNFSDKYQAFSRFDYISSNKPEGFISDWNIDNDGKLIIGGVQYMLQKQIKLAINYRGWMPEANDKVSSYLFFDIEIAF